jgi:hypothetical protein
MVAADDHIRAIETVNDIGGPGQDGPHATRLDRVGNSRR